LSGDLEEVTVCVDSPDGGDPDDGRLTGVDAAHRRLEAPAADMAIIKNIVRVQHSSQSVWSILKLCVIKAQGLQQYA